MAKKGKRRVTSTKSVPSSFIFDGLILLLFLTATPLADCRWNFFLGRRRTAYNEWICKITSLNFIHFIQMDFFVEHPASEWECRHVGCSFFQRSSICRSFCNVCIIWVSHSAWRRKKVFKYHSFTPVSTCHYFFLDFSYHFPNVPTLTFR